VEISRASSQAAGDVHEIITFLGFIYGEGSSQLGAREKSKISTSRFPLYHWNDEAQKRAAIAIEGTEGDQRGELQQKRSSAWRPAPAPVGRTIPAISVAFVASVADACHVKNLGQARRAGPCGIEVRNFRR
jgi:hypothetical protein